MPSIFKNKMFKLYIVSLLVERQKLFQRFSSKIKVSPSFVLNETLSVMIFHLHVFFYKHSKFRKQAEACLWKILVQAQSMLALCLFIKICLVYAYEKDLIRLEIFLLRKKFIQIYTQAMI